MRYLRLLFIPCFFVILSGCGGRPVPKINGLSFVASRAPVFQEHVTPMMEVHAGYAAVMPFGFIRDAGSPEIIFDSEHQWYGETSKGALECIQLLHENNLRVMLKPQLWIRRGQFTGHLEMQGEEGWKLLEASYEKFILHYARLAQDAGAEIFCIGTELGRFVQHRPAYWQDLIGKIRKVYQGELTYAANWDEYESTPFWASLDYIGIDAYFPLSEEKTPEVESLMQAWKPWKEQIEQLSRSQKRPVMFTEFGYRSMDFTANKPWETSREPIRVNLQAQANAKEALFRTFWKEEWFAGGFVWKWFVNHSEVGGTGCDRFTPQNKPAQEVIKRFYASYRETR